MNLQVKFAEVSRSLVREIGGNLTTIDGAQGGFRGGVGTGRELSGESGFNTGGPLSVGPGAGAVTGQRLITRCVWRATS